MLILAPNLTIFCKILPLQPRYHPLPPHPKGLVPCFYRLDRNISYYSSPPCAHMEGGTFNMLILTSNLTLFCKIPPLHPHPKSFDLCFYRLDHNISYNSSPPCAYMVGGSFNMLILTSNFTLFCKIPLLYLLPQKFWSLFLSPRPQHFVLLKSTMCLHGRRDD